MSNFKNPWEKGGELYPDFEGQAKEDLFENNEKVVGDDVLLNDKVEYSADTRWLYIYSNYNKDSSQVFLDSSTHYTNEREKKLPEYKKNIKNSEAKSAQEILDIISNQKANSIQELYYFSHAGEFGLYFKEDESMEYGLVKRNMYITHEWEVISYLKDTNIGSLGYDSDEKTSTYIDNINFSKFNDSSVIWLAGCGSAGAPWLAVNPLGSYTDVDTLIYDLNYQGFPGYDLDKKLLESYIKMGEKIDTTTYNISKRLSELFYLNGKKNVLVIGSFGSTAPGKENDYDWAPKCFYHNNKLIHKTKNEEPITQTLIDTVRLKIIK